MNITLLRIPTGRRQTSWLFTSVAEDLNSGLPRNKSWWWSERDSRPGPPNCESDTLTTWPRCLLKLLFALYAPRCTMYPLSATSLRCTRYDLPSKLYQLLSALYALSLGFTWNLLTTFRDTVECINLGSAVGCKLLAVFQAAGKNIECWFFHFQLGIQVILDIALTLYRYLYLTLLVSNWPHKCNSLHAQYCIWIAVICHMVDGFSALQPQFS